jgi:hypothetical protein
MALRKLGAERLNNNEVQIRKLQAKELARRSMSVSRQLAESTRSDQPRGFGKSTR